MSNQTIPASTPIPPSRPTSRQPVVTSMTTQNIAIRRPNQVGSPVMQIQQPTPSASADLTPSSTSIATSKSFSEENPDFSPIELPSGFQFYSFKTLSARTLKGSHQAKFHRAYTQNKLRFIVEAISATLEPNVSAFDLTPADFYFLMYWQRVNSFTKSPQIITGKCTNKEHLARVYTKPSDLPEGVTPLEKDSLQIEQFLNSTSLDTKSCDTLDLVTAKIGLESYSLGVETMKDVVEMTETMIEMADPDNTSLDVVKDSIDEYGWLASKASFLTNEISLADRIKIVGDMSAEEVTLLEQYMQTVTNYGVEEHAAIRCKECGASKRVKISFDALSFLPGGR